MANKAFVDATVRTEILNLLYSLDNKPNSKTNHLDLKSFFLANYDQADPVAIKRVLRKMKADKVISLSSGINSLGATYGGQLQGILQITAHAKIVAKGKTEIGK